MLLIDNPRSFDYNTFIALTEDNIDLVDPPKHMLLQLMSLVSNACTVL